MDQQVTFKTVNGESVTLPAKDYLYSKRDEGNPAVRTLVFYTGQAPDGGFLNTPYTISAQDADEIVASIRKIIFGR